MYYRKPNPVDLTPEDTAIWARWIHVRVPYGWAPINELGLTLSAWYMCQDRIDSELMFEATSWRRVNYFGRWMVRPERLTFKGLDCGGTISRKCA